jgi:hypothetical protein
MKYIKVPQAVMLPQIDLRTKETIVREYRFSDMLEQIVWPHEIWRNGSRDSAEMLIALHAKFHGAEAGDVVELSEQEYEAFAPIVTLKGEKLNPSIAMEMMTLMNSVICASTVRPEPPSK